MTDCPIESPSAPAEHQRDKAQETMADLHALVYVSSATRLLSTVELNQLLAAARVRNAQEGVTGVLLYSHGNFMQYLEGPAAGMRHVYDIIKADAKHAAIIELLREPIRSREFSEWSMGFRDISAFGKANPPNIDAAILSARPARSQADSAAHVLLRKFWDKGGVRSDF
jgi:hypothetical protein